MWGILLASFSDVHDSLSSVAFSVIDSVGDIANQAMVMLQGLKLGDSIWPR